MTTTSSEAPVTSMGTARASAGEARPAAFRLSPGTLVVSAGSGFARHLPEYLRQHGLTYLVTESAHPIVPKAMAIACGYGEYSARYGDIYTSRHLLQLVRRARGVFQPYDDRWELDGRYFDPFRPSIQPEGFASEREFEAERCQHLAAVRQAFERMDVFVVTLRDTSAWASTVDGAVYPLQRSEVVSAYDPHRYERIELSTLDVIADLTALLTELRGLNAGVRLVLTTSPERTTTGLTGNSGSETRSKAVLRAALREVAGLPGVAYFPAYEVLTESSRERHDDPTAGAGEGVERSLRLFLRWAGRTPERQPAPARPGDDAASVWDTLERAQTASHEQFVRDMQAIVTAACDEDPREAIKCVVWDLDDTLWHGVLLEDERITLRSGIRELLEALDRRGIVHSIASRNDPDAATGKLAELGLSDYFIYPQINWGSKAASVRRIADLLNIAPDAMAFVDDQPFERDEVAFTLAGVTCIDAAAIESLVEMPRLNPRFVTEDARTRRQLYVADARRRDAEHEFAGSSEQFLATLGMTLSIWPVTTDDLDRAEELTHRTHQLNSTGRRYTRADLDALRAASGHLLLMASLSDRYGPYGKVGLSIVELGADAWTIALLLASCRVMNRGVTAVLIRHLMNLAARAHVHLRAEFAATDRNRPMLNAYLAAGFTAAERPGGTPIFEAPPLEVQPFPSYLRVDLAAATVAGATRSHD
jgi:FkbH-like protein